MKYRGLVGTTKTIIAEEGAGALWNGLTAGLHRQILFSGIRVGLYQPVKNLITGDLPEGQNPLLYQKMMAASITGAIGITVANPTDVVKVRLQNQRKVLNMDSLHYSGTMDCYRKIIKHEGIKGLWTSWSANCFRNSVINCAELASYD
jgi:solute carrier family 25 uncoupling protein 8/9